MAQVSYGTITITDTNDIEKIYMEYAQSTSNQTAPTSGWDTDIPTWQQGKYIWQRTVTKMSGVALSSDSYGEPVCLTGSTGSTGAAGRSVSSIVTTYCNYGDGTPADNYSGWQSTVPAYDSTKPNYWVKTVITYSNPTKTSTTKYKDNGITSATSTAAAANSVAQAANQTANQANTTASEAKTIAEGASSAISDLNQYFWRQKTAATNVPAGSYVTNVPGTTYKNNPASGGFNSLVQATGIFLRNGITTLSSWTGDALTFNNPSTGNAQLIIGANGTLQSGNYTRGSDSKFSSNGTKIDLINGDIITKYFRVSQGLESGLNAGVYVHGTIEALDGRIGTGYTPAGGIETNYWEIGNYDDYNLHNTAKIIGHGSSFIQLGDASTWRLSTNRIHTGWYSDNDTVLHYPQDSNNKYWDFGIHAPYSDSPSGRGNDKFIYIRTQKAANNSLENLLYDLNDNYSTQQWDYKFWIDAEGKVHAQNFYIGNSTTPIGGGVGTTAEKIINSDGTYGKGSTTQPIYLDSNGRPATTTYALNAAGAKGVDTSISAASTSTNLPTSQAVAAFVEGKGYITSYTDNKVQTSQANTTKVFLVGTSTAGTSTGTLNFDSNVYLTTNAGTLHATTFEGNLSGTASRATADGDGNKISTTYLKLSGGNVTGAVTFGSSVSVDELTAGDLVVNGAASFTNNLQANTINGVTVGSSPKFTDTVTTVTVTGSGNAVTSARASNGAVTLTKGATFLTSYTETDPIFVASAAHGITSNDISNWNSKTSNTGTVTSVAASGSGGITISGSPITTNGTITIGLNLSTAINGLGEGSSPATRDDYIVAQYAGGGTTTTTYHRRKLSNIFAALNKSDITTALGYTPPTQDTNTHYTTHLYVNNNTTTNQNTTTALTNGNVYLHLYDDSTKRDSHKISGSGTVSVTSDTSGNIVITGSAHPTSLKNPNALSIKVYNGTSSSTNTSYDGSTANQSVSVASTNAITGINSTTDGKLQLTLADGSQPEPISIKITATTSDSAASADKLNLSKNVGSLTQPVYFDANTGLPVATTYSLNKTVPSDAKFTDTWIAMVGATSNANGTAGYVSAPPKDGYNTKFLRADGTWVVPGGTYSLPLAANGTRGGVQIGYSGSGKNYAVQLSNEKMYVNVPWTDTTYSAGTGLSLTGTTFANTGVTGVKGNAESTYRTGQVNLTAANVGAVAISGNETVSGNKTFSGTTSLTAGSTYPAQMGTVIPANSSAIIQSPVPKYLWHDLWAFCRATTPTYYTTTDGTNWTQGTLDKRLFGHANAWGVSNVISNTISGSRWVWHGGGFAYCSGAWLALGVAYSDKIAKFDLKLEGTSDATATSPTWTELCSVTNARYNSTPIWIKTNGPSVNDVRLTITRASGEATTTMLPLCSIMWLSSRWGNQGKGEEYEHPYSWDSNYNIYPLSGAKFVGDVTGNASGTASNVTGTVAIDHGGTGATSAQNATWNLLHVSDPGDLNNAKRGGSFKISNTTTNTPVNDMWGATINVTDDSAGGNTGTSGSTWQIVLQSGNNNMWLRCITNANSWTDYAKFYTTANKPTKSDIGLSNVENKSSATIRGELTSSNVTTALGYTPVNKAGDTMTGALNTANGTANKIGDDSQLGDFNVVGTLGIQGLNGTTGVALLQKGTTWGATGNYAHITYDGTYIKANKLLQITANSNTVTIGSQNNSFTHIYNSASIPFIFNNSVLTTSGDLGNNTYAFNNLYMKGGLNMLNGTTQKARMAYNSSLDALVFSFA